MILTDGYGLEPMCRAREVGAGSGIATAGLLARGARVTAVEPGDALANMLRTSVHAALPVAFARSLMVTRRAGPTRHSRIPEDESAHA